MGNAKALWGQIHDLRQAHAEEMDDLIRKEASPGEGRFVPRQLGDTCVYDSETDEGPQRTVFTPSIHVRGKRRITDEEHARIMAGETIDLPPRVCHSFVTGGQIRFLDDCTHPLAGRTVKLVPPDMGEVRA